MSVAHPLRLLDRASADEYVIWTEWGSFDDAGVGSVNAYCVSPSGLDPVYTNVLGWSDRATTGARARARL